MAAWHVTPCGGGCTWYAWLAAAMVVFACMQRAWHAERDLTWLNVTQKMGLLWSSSILQVGRQMQACMLGLA